MRVFCTACGTPHEGEPGGSVVCSACSATFEIPRELGDTPRPPATSRSWGEGSQASVADGDPAAPFPSPNRAAPLTVGSAEAPSLFERPRTNNWAIASLVSGFCCVVPVLSPLGGLVCGVIALQQINEDRSQQGKGLAISGIVLGLLSGAVTLVTLVNLLH